MGIVTRRFGLAGSDQGVLKRFRPHWPVWMAFALLAGCGDAAQAPAGRELTQPAPQAQPAVVSVREDITASPAVSRNVVNEDEEADKEAQAHAGDSLEAQVQALLASGRRIAARRALRLLLEARQSDEADTALAEPAERAARILIDWDRLALAHDATGLAERDLPLLQRWDEGDAQVQALGVELERVQRIVAGLEQADRLMAAGRLVDAGGANAVAPLQEVLQRDPLHDGARRRLQSIEATLLAQVLAAAQAGEFERADALLADAGKVRAGSVQVQDTAARVVEVRERHAQMWKRRIGDALAAGDVAAAEALLPRLDAVALDERDGVDARADIERVRRYGPYDAGMLLADPLASGGLGPGMVVVPVGRFAMGSANGEAGRQSNEGPRHAVRFERGFALARTETTVGQFRAFVQATGYRNTARKTRRSMVYEERSGALVEQRRVSWGEDYSGEPAADDAPVLHVSWVDARAYAQWLAQETGAPYRLPSETEFEYALRAGSTTRYPWGDGALPSGVENLTGALDQSPQGRRWSNAFAGYGDGFWGPAPVGSFASNPFGLNDLNGNVSEWVEDCWHDSYVRAPRDGSAWVNPGCTQRVIRGASWASSPDQARSAFRIRAPADTVSARVGFRVARDL